MKTKEDASRLAESMVNIGKKCGRNMAAVITNMDVPLGNNVGNVLEVIEAAELLKNPKKCDLMEVCIALSSNMVALVKNINVSEAEKLVTDALYSGKAYNKMKEWIAAQGGDVKYVENPELFGKSTFEVDIISDRDGYISKMDTEAIGVAACILGAGRTNKDDKIDSLAGIVITKKTGDAVKKGEKIGTLYSESEEKISVALEKYLSALTVAETPCQAEPIIYKIIS
jgi:thymidine phosphorylase